MSILNAIELLEKAVPNPSLGLPDDVFYYISKTTPMINVDLLIQDEKKRTLLAWREDLCAGVGWHIPGGIIRFKETLHQRLQKVAQLEVGVEKIDFDPKPLDINEIILEDSDIRGHFISILYRCFLPGTFIPMNKDLGINDPGFLKWHERCPDDLLKPQNIYIKYF